MLQLTTRVEYIEQHTQAQADQQSSRELIPVVNTPCRMTHCASFDIEPEQFLDAPVAPVCWDCRFIAQKLRM